MSLEIMLFLGVGVVGLLGLGAYALKLKGRMAAWANVASTFGLHLDKERMSGEVDGVDVSVRLEWRTTRRNNRRQKHQYTVVQSTMPHVNFPDGFSMGPEGVMQKLGKLVQGQDIKLGIDDLDRKLLIRSADAHRARALLCVTDEAVDALRGLVSVGGDFKVDVQGLKVEFRGALGNAAKLQTLVSSIATLGNEWAEADLENA